MPIHPSAIIDRRAEIDPTAEIGAYTIIDGVVRIGPGVRVFPHAYLTGWTEIGADNVIHVGAVLGHEPQDVAYKGDETYLRVGDRNVFREYTLIHRGTKADVPHRNAADRQGDGGTAALQHLDSDQIARADLQGLGQRFGQDQPGLGHPHWPQGRVEHPRKLRVGRAPDDPQRL